MILRAADKAFLGSIDHGKSLSNGSLSSAVFRLLTLRLRGPLLLFYIARVATLRIERAKSNTAQPSLQGNDSFTAEIVGEILGDPSSFCVGMLGMNDAEEV